MSEGTKTDPSLTAGNDARQSEDMLATMEAVLPIFMLPGHESEAQAGSFIEQRVAELSLTTTASRIGNSYGGTDRFINEDVEMIGTGLFHAPYHLDDPVAYAASFPHIKQAFQQYSGQMSAGKAYVNAVITGANLGQVAYFESYKGSEEGRDRALDDIISDSDVPKPRKSIAELKRVAVCQERAAVAHNTLLIFGVASTYEKGTVGVKNEEDGTIESEPHAFLTFSNDEGDIFIFDPTNPVLFRDETGKPVAAHPSVYKLNLNERGEHHDTLREYRLVNGTPQEMTKEVVYTFSHELAE